MSRYRVFEEGSRFYFTTSTIVEWTHIFTEKRYFDLIIDSLKYCQQHKGLELVGYVIMLNHLHLITYTEEGVQLSYVMGDFKKFTSKKITKQLRQDNRKLPLYIFRKAAERSRENQEYKVWEDGFHPQQIFSLEMLRQKLDYLHVNPVRKGFVERPEHWLYSSARNYVLGDHSVIRINIDLWW
jgi:REP element-mobilizing transposase RayT